MRFLLFAFIFILTTSQTYSQTIVNRSGAANTVQDARLSALYNFFLPRFTDTTAANLQKGIDSSGALIFTTSDNKIWKRNRSPKMWIPLGDNTNLDGLISGGVVSWSGQGLKFYITSAVYYIKGIRYTSPSDSVTLNAADPTNPRLDVIGLDTTGRAIKITGTAAANPSIPQINPSNQLSLTTILINAGATIPNGVSSVLVYNENVEWTTSSTTTTPINFNNTLFPFNGVKSAYNLLLDGYAQFQSPTTQYFSDYSLLTLHIYLPLPLKDNQDIGIAFYKNNAQVSQVVSLSSQSIYGFSNSIAGQYQNIAIPINNFNTSADNFNQIRIQSFQSSVQAFYVDYIRLQTGSTNNQSGGNYVTDIYKRQGTDSVFFTKGNAEFFSFLDQKGVTSITAFSPLIQEGTPTAVELSVDTTAPDGLATQYDLTRIGIQTVLNNDSSLNRNNTINAKNNNLTFDSVKYLVFKTIDGFELYNQKDSFQASIANGGGGDLEILAESNYNINSINFRSSLGSRKGISIASKDSIYFLNENNQNVRYAKSTNDTTLNRLLMLTTTGALVTASPSIVGGGGSTVDTTSLSNRINTKLNIVDTANIRARLTQGTNVTITGTYPNLTIAASGTDSTVFQTNFRSDSARINIYNQIATRKANNDSIGNAGFTSLFQYNKGKDSLNALIISASGWLLNGNSNTDSSINFIGTSDSRRLVFRTNNLTKLIITNDGATGEPLLMTNGGGATSFFVTAARKTNNQPSLLFQATNTFINGVNGNTILQGTNISNSYWGGLYSNIAKPMLINEAATGSTSPSSLFQISKSGINATQKDSFGITLSTPDAATSGNPKYSPPIVFSGRNFNTGTSASYDNLWRIYNKTISGVNTNVSGSLVFENSFAGGAYAERMQITGGGLTAQLIVPSVATNTISAQSGGVVSFSNKIYVTENAANGLVGTLYIGGNPSSIAASAQLDVASTTKGFLPPRMTNTQRTAISSPAIGLIVYCTDAVEGLYIYKSTGWTFIM